jgi:CRISPR/Cas system CMR subunit Cmr6 (Cas7 group RAMP superfamily)
LENSSSKAKIVKKLSTNMVKKMSKNCQKMVKKLSKSCRKAVKKLLKVAKNCQHFFKKVVKKFSKKGVWGVGGVVVPRPSASASLTGQRQQVGAPTVPSSFIASSQE